MDGHTGAVADDAHNYNGHHYGGDAAVDLVAHLQRLPTTDVTHVLHGERAVRISASQSGNQACVEDD